MSSPKFDEMLAKLEAAGKGAKGAKSAAPAEFPDEIHALAEALFSKHHQSASAQAATDPTMAEKVKDQNAKAAVMMPVATSLDSWIVQVFPDDSNIAHFQASPAPIPKDGTPCPYLRWYMQFDESLWQQLKQAHNEAMFAGNGLIRPSMHSESQKPYLVCKRISETKVEIPGYGVVEVPELFNMDMD